MGNKLLRLFFISLADLLLLTGLFYVFENVNATHINANIRYVAPGGACGTANPCYAHPQAAIDAANAGDEIRVATGVYHGVSARNGMTQAVHLDKSIALRGGYDLATWTQDPTANPTMLDAGGQGRVLYITGEITPLIEGLHLTNGSAAYGGGVYVHSATATLQKNQIYSNTAESWGGGIYLEDSAATIANNHITSNTTGSNGRGGGLALSDSPALIYTNTIAANQAHVGGGVELGNSLGDGGATLRGNVVEGNTAFDYQQGGYTFDGAGGGINTGSGYTDTVANNVIRHNTAKWGGGLHAFNAPVIVSGNTIQENTAPTHGGGLYVQGSYPTIENNRILSNTATNWGGGMCIWVGAGTVSGNTFQGNTAGWRGGGLYAQGAPELDANLFRANTATEQGGGIFFYGGSGAVFQNSVIIDNQANEGGGLYLWGTTLQFTHSTIANNSRADGNAVVIDKYPGLVDPGAAQHTLASVDFVNTIFADQSVGVFATPANTLTIDGVLWYNTPTPIKASGANLTLLNEYSGDPIFQADGYHLRAYSAARDKGVSDLEHDVDGQLRDWGDQKDLGADEFVPTAVIDPEIGGTVTYTNPQEGVTITLDVPPGAISVPLGLMFSPFPPLPPDVMDSPFGKFVAVGPPFRLDPFNLDPSVPVTDTLDPPLGDPSEPLIFGYPAHLALEYDLETLRKMRESMDRLELQLLALIEGGMPTLRQNPACGPVDHDLDARTMDVPICDTGIISGTFGSATRLPVRLLAVDAESETGYFIFVVEVEEKKVYLPLIMH